MVEKPLYDGRKIFRVIKGFMFQTGSATDTNADTPRTQENQRRSVAAELEGEHET